MVRESQVDFLSVVPPAPAYCCHVSRCTLYSRAALPHPLFTQEDLLLICGDCLLPKRSNLIKCVFLFVLEWCKIIVPLWESTDKKLFCFKFALRDWLSPSFYLIFRFKIVLQQTVCYAWKYSLNKAPGTKKTLLIVLIALGYGLDDWDSRVRFPAGAGNFSLHHRVQNGSGAHPDSYLMGTRDSFLGDKATGAWSWPPPPSAEVKECGLQFRP
jgi:hypothetical protein